MNSLYFIFYMCQNILAYIKYLCEIFLFRASYSNIFIKKIFRRIYLNKIMISLKRKIQLQFFQCIIKLIKKVKNRETATLEKTLLHI